MGKARVLVSSELLVQQVPLPLGTRIVDAHMQDDPIGSANLAVVLYVEHPTLPEIPFGDPVPRRDVLCEKVSTRFGEELP